MLKRMFLVVALVVLLSSQVFALQSNTRDVMDSTDGTSIAVASTGTIYTKAMYIGDAEYFAVSYWIYSASGTADITIQLEQSWTLPATEGAADGNYVISEIEGATAADIVTALTRESVWFNASRSIFIALPYVRFKITGISSNNADTIVKMKLTTVLK